MGAAQVALHLGLGVEGGDGAGALFARAQHEEQVPALESLHLVGAVALAVEHDRAAQRRDQAAVLARCVGGIAALVRRRGGDGGRGRDAEQRDGADRGETCPSARVTGWGHGSSLGWGWDLGCLGQSAASGVRLLRA